MKKSMPAFITELSGNDFEVLEEIFINKYKKFIQLYWLISEYSDNISKLKYKDSEESILSIELKVSGLKPDLLIKGLSEDLNDDSEVMIWNEKSLVHITIKDEES